MNYLKEIFKKYYSNSIFLTIFVGGIIIMILCEWYPEFFNFLNIKVFDTEFLAFFPFIIFVIFSIFFSLVKVDVKKILFSGLLYSISMIILGSFIIIIFKFLNYEPVEDFGVKIILYLSFIYNILLLIPIILAIIFTFTFKKKIFLK